ncbi:MAG: outer membrane lipoprotein-sorting protein [Halothermotrichaceae bacterium]
MFNNMKFTGKMLAAVLLVLVLSTPTVLALTAEEIIEKRDENEYYVSARMEAEMIIKGSNNKRVKEMVSITDGEDSYTYFTNPRDRGTKYLKKDDKLYMFFADAEEIVPISGHLLEKSMEGSDFSYKDMMESEKLTELYDFELLEENAEYNGRPCYVIEGIKKEGKEDVQYYRRKAWVDKERFIGLKGEYYAQSGRLLKESRVTKVEKVQGRWYPMEFIMENKLKQDTSTQLIINSIKFDPEIPAGTFTLRNLQS